jgi:hypothetical protein
MERGVACRAVLSKSSRSARGAISSALLRASLANEANRSLGDILCLKRRHLSMSLLPYLSGAGTQLPFSAPMEAYRARKGPGSRMSLGGRCRSNLLNFPTETP